MPKRHGIVHGGVDPSHVIVGGDDAAPSAHLLSIDGARLRCAQRAIPHGQRICRGPLSMIHYDTRYLAPEGIAGAPASERGDVFAAGLLLFELLTGRHPFAAGSEMETTAAIVHAPTPPLPLPLAPAALAELVARALVKDPAARISAAALRDDAAAVAAQLPFARGKRAHGREPIL